MISFVQFFAAAVILLCLQVSVATSAMAADKVESDDYLDCLLDKLPGTDSDRAAELIKAACRERFSRPVMPRAEQFSQAQARSEVAIEYFWHRVRTIRDRRQAAFFARFERVDREYRVAQSRQILVGA